MIIETNENGDEIRLGTTVDIATMLRLKTHVVRNWYRHRQAYGFPDPVGTRLCRINGLHARHWDLDVVSAWFILTNGSL